MDIHVITLFPEAFRQMLEAGVVGRAIGDDRVRLHTWNPRDYTEDRHRRVDDRPYGGGPGMVMSVEPLRQTIRAIRAKTGGRSKVSLMSPQGRPFDQTAARELAGREHLVLLCGRYEGIDERLIALEVDEEWSIGDYVLSGGELPAAVVIDSVTRLLPGVLGNAESAGQDSFWNGLLDCPHYTRPEEYEGLAVPPVLVSGDHQAIDRWRKKQSLLRTLERRPELLENLTLDEESEAMLEACRQQLSSEDQENDEHH
ncbi:MAG: tRNA (guanosine(37)-N1)-methyltransferase TrmD [Xanthomonadales bacterium]|nr:tRNA (guanosine(37)-N1)-methyltransferase TrmD [Xanthomonadales bacterium]